MTPPRKPTDRSHIHRAEDIYAPGDGDLQSIGEAGLGGAEQTVLSATVTLTDAQIKALPATLVEVVPGPDAGQVIHIVQAFFLPSAVFVDYTNIGAAAEIDVIWALSGIARVSLPNDVGNELTELSDLLQGSRKTVRPYFEMTSAWGPVHLDVGEPGEAIAVRVAGNSGDFTGGDPANTLKVTVHYVVIDL